MELKYMVEMVVPDEKLNQLNQNPAGLKIDNLVETRVTSALFPLCGSDILVYRADEGKKPMDLYKLCPACGHPWAFHFEQVKQTQVQMSDGSAGVRGVIGEPVPIPCGVCDATTPCHESLKFK